MLTSKTNKTVYLNKYPNYYYSKYVVTATIMQKNGAGVHSANALWVDPSNDGIVTVKWPTDKKGDGNKTMYCIVNVLALNF